MRWTALLDGARAFFGVRGEVADADAKLAATVERVRRSREAAEALWLRGSEVEALANLAKIDVVELPPLVLPTRDADVTAEHRAWFRRAVLATRDFEDEHRAAILDFGGRARLRAVRVAGALVLVALGVAFVRLVFDHHGVRVRASSHRGISWADNAVDETPRTEWALPDGTPGWIEIEFHEPRDTSTVRIMSGRERAIGDWQLDAWAGDTLVARASGNCNVESPKWQTVELRGNAVTRVRLTVRTWKGASGGLGELWVD